MLIGPTLPAAFEPESSQAPVAPTSSAPNDGADKASEKSKTKDHQAPPQDKVKVAKKIVKDMEKWAKQLNQKKDYSVLQPPARIEEATLYSSLGPASRPLAMESHGGASAGYADVGFSLLEKKERLGAGGSDGYAASGKPTQGGNIPSGSQYGGAGSDSDHEYGDEAGPAGARERDLVDFEALTCLLCKRAFQSQEILAKHLKMSALHKENLKKLNRGGAAGGSGGGGGGGSSDGGSGGPSSLQQYRDRAKERRAKYGEDDAPPVNRSKERFQRELEKQTTSSYQQSTSVSAPISQNNVGNKLLQKMGWSEGQGLGKSNQGRVNIIEVSFRLSAERVEKHFNFLIVSY